jgi:hypothetical protein
MGGYGDATNRLARRVCWDGARKCHDSQAVARDAIRKIDPELFKALDDLPYERVRVHKNGTVTVRRR